MKYIEITIEIAKLVVWVFGVGLYMAIAYIYLTV